MQQHNLNLSLKKELRLDLSKIIKLLFIGRIIPILAIYYGAYFYLRLFDEQNETYKLFHESALYIIETKTYWLVIAIFIIPSYIIIHDVIEWIIRGVISILKCVLSPSYIKIYQCGIFIKGVGYIKNEHIQNYAIHYNKIIIRVNKNSFSKPNILKQFIHSANISIDSKQENEVITINVKFDHLNMPIEEIKNLLPSHKKNYKKLTDYTSKLNKRQRYTLTNPDDIV